MSESYLFLFLCLRSIRWLNHCNFFFLPHICFPLMSLVLLRTRTVSLLYPRWYLGFKKLSEAEMLNLSRVDSEVRHGPTLLSQAPGAHLPFLGQNIHSNGGVISIFLTVTIFSCLLNWSLWFHNNHPLILYLASWDFAKTVLIHFVSKCWVFKRSEL